MAGTKADTKNTSTEDAYLKACAQVRGLALRYFADDRKALERSVEVIAQNSFVLGVKWGLGRKLTAKEKALLKTLEPPVG
jgi:hypothetical protein